MIQDCCYSCYEGGNREGGSTGETPGAVHTGMIEQGRDPQEQCTGGSSAQGGREQWRDPGSSAQGSSVQGVGSSAQGDIGSSA